MKKASTVSTKIDGYRVEIIHGEEVACVVTGEILLRELKANLTVLKATGKIEHAPSGESHDVSADTIARISDWAAQNGYVA